MNDPFTYPPEDPPSPLTQAERASIKPHRPACLWFTGLSGSGKTTIASAVERRLNGEFGAHTYLLDGDTLRSGLNRDLGFSLADRAENIRRAGEVARLFVDAGLIVLAAFISPQRDTRERARQIVQPAGPFYEIYVECPLAVCEQRDPKRFYRLARQGVMTDFTGITSPYEPPTHPDLILHSVEEPPDRCAGRVIAFLEEQKLFSR